MHATAPLDAGLEEHDACGIGLLADLGGSASHLLITQALAAVGAMSHRGARSADGRTGDGAGILCETPRAYFARELAASGLRAPLAHLAAICVFFPRDPEAVGALRGIVESALRRLDITPLRWRRPHIDEHVLGDHARATRPSYEQLIVDMGPGNVRQRMRSARAAIDRAFHDLRGEGVLLSASETSVLYKGLLSSNEIGSYFADLRDPLFTSRFAVFHQRFSTNSAPAWRLVQPFSHIAHNGEINTITGNRAWQAARGIRSVAGASDSYDFDVAVEAMIGAGYRIDHAIDLLLAPAVDAADERLRAYYDAHLPTVEPWDGPAAIAFADSDIVGAALDRAGLRPLRYCRTQSGKVLVASEAGVVDFGGDEIIERGRLGPAGRFIVRFATGELVHTAAFRTERRESADFRALTRSWQFAVAEPATKLPEQRDLSRFGWYREEVKDVVGVLAEGKEPVLSMGDDAALGFLERRIPVASYLRERFAQVTNPPIDPLRESFVFDMRAFVGSGESNGDVPVLRSIVALESGILSENDFDRLCADDRLRVRALDLALGETTLAARIDLLCAQAVTAVHDGISLLVLDNRADDLAVPVLLAVGAIHQELSRAGLRMAISLAAADGFIRDAHAAAAVIAMGANVVTPWLGERVAARDGDVQKYIGALRAGLLKILSKLGICTLRSYVGAQTFEALGLAREVVERCFPGVRHHVPAIDFAALEADLRIWHTHEADTLDDRGSFRFRRNGLRRSFDPLVIKQLRASAMQGDYAAFEALSDAMEARDPISLRDLISARPLRSAINVHDVEEVAAIVPRFATAAMSLGSLAPEVHEIISRAANRLGARGNSGEGGEQARRYDRTPGNGRSRIKQIASARFGVGAHYLASADEIEIKIAQGSKPGEGGQIPGEKVTEEIAYLRGAVIGQTLISPPPHHDIYSIEDLAELIYDLRRAAPQARIAVKLVSQSGIGYVASGVAKADADVIHISGHDGGTGASPLGSMKYAGLPWELGLVETHHALLATGLRSRVQLRVDGGFKSGRDVVLASLLGADEFAFGSALLVALGCIYARQCHKNTCPVGIATQNEALRAKFAGTEEEAMHFLTFVARDVRRRLAALGARSLREIRGRSDLLHARNFPNGEYGNVDLSAILRLPEYEEREHWRPEHAAHLDDAAGTHDVLSIGPADRAVGARLAAEIVQRRQHGEHDAAYAVHYRGTAGQSFGAFITAGVNLDIDGDANDYVGKSMEGGSIVVRGHGRSHEPAIGNACFYGARGGSAYVFGSAGERLAVRNSGAEIVVEGAGDHACEYMTSGMVVILGPLGGNVASGMSGGSLYILDASHIPLGPTSCKAASAREATDEHERLHALLSEHHRLTGSVHAAELIHEWPASLQRLTRVG